MNQELKAYIEQEILPRYAHFDAAHRLDHANMVIEQSLQLVTVVTNSPRYLNPDGSNLVVNPDMAYAIAAYHDTGLCEGRERHHLVSGRIIREDAHLQRWFTPEQIEIMAQAAEDHRASAKQEPRSIYGKIVAEADRAIRTETIIRRTVQYGIAHYPEMNKEQQYERMKVHLKEKYAEGGYLKLQIPESPNGVRLEKLREAIRDEKVLKEIFEKEWENL